MQSREIVKQRIKAAMVDLEIPNEVAEDIAFHMTDWKEDLQDMIRLYESAPDLSDDQVQNLVFDFLVHVPNHVAAAKKLAGLGPIQDIFKVGVLEDDED